MISLLAAALLLAPRQSDYRERFPLPGPTVPDGWGVNVHLRGEGEASYNKLKALGVKWARMDLSWSRVEKEQGQYDFSDYDVMLGRFRERGIRALVVLDYGNKIYGADAVRTREGRAAFAQFATEAVQRFRGRGIVWEIWNEPNTEKFWQSKPSADEYAALVRVTGEAIRNTASQEWIAGPATSKFDWPFIQRVLEEGALKYLDAITVHPYRINQPPEGVMDDWRRLRGLVDRYAPEGKQVALINSEWGWSLADSKISPEKQAQYAVRQYLTNLASGVNLNIWYSFVDKGEEADERDQNFGLLTEDLQAKPSYKAIQDTVQKLSGYKFVGQVDLGEENTYAVMFQKGMSRKLAVWSRLPTEKEVRVPAALSAFMARSGVNANSRTLRIKNAVQILEERW